MKIEFNKLNPKAIILGFLADNVATIVFTFIMFFVLTFLYAMNGGNIDDPNKLLKMYYSSIPLLLTTFVVGISFTVMGGYIAARIAKGYEVLNSVVVGVIDIIIGAFSFFEHTYPVWYQVLALLLAVPAAYLGGILAQKQHAAAKVNS